MMHSIPTSFNNDTSVLDRPTSIYFRRLSLVLVGAALLIDLLTPYLIWKRILPSTVRWIPDLCLAAVIALVLAQMLLSDRIPKAALFVLAISLIWGTVATFEGQPLAATTWGWWRLLRYPMAGLLIYLQEDWPSRYDRYLIQLCVGVLTFEVCFQILQFLGGMIPSDDLAGSFGSHGVGPLHFYLLFVTCLSFGQWLATGSWRLLAYVIFIGIVSSVLGEMKAYSLFVAMLAVISGVIYLIRGGKLYALVLFVLFFGLTLTGFVLLYNNFVADVRGTREIQDFLSSESREQYLGRVRYREEQGTYTLGRNNAIEIGLQSIQKDATSLIFGMGLGARAESSALGIVGAGLEQSYYGLATGTSLLVFLNEFGLGGMLFLSVAALYLVILFLRNLRRDLNPHLATLHYGLILCTIMWPIWFWYHQVWLFSVFMVLYWGTVGYVLSRVRDERVAGKL